MIDLRNNGLPKTVDVCGSPFLIKTDFREWLKFSEMIKGDCKLSDFEFLFVDKVPIVNFYKELVNFFINKNETPRLSTGRKGDIVIDYIKDGEYIVSSFMQAYKIDLTSIDYLHWHLFKALFVGLPDDTKIKQIISYRSYKKRNISSDTARSEMRSIWRLDQKDYEENKETKDKIRNHFIQKWQENAKNKEKNNKK